MNGFEGMIAQRNARRRRAIIAQQQEEWNMRMQHIRNLNAAEPGWRNRIVRGEVAEWNRNHPPRPVLNIELEEGQPILRVDDANHIGVLTLNLKKQFPNGNSLSLDEFVDGEELVRLNRDNRFVFKKDSLQNWFNMGKGTNPLSRQVVTPAEIERFKYKEDLSLGGMNVNLKGKKGCIGSSCSVQGGIRRNRKTKSKRGCGRKTCGRR